MLNKYPGVLRENTCLTSPYRRQGISLNSLDTPVLLTGHSAVLLYWGKICHQVQGVDRLVQLANLL
jgi:hypothetical protein